MEQAQSRLELIIQQMKAAEGVTEGMMQHNQMTWVGAMNSLLTVQRKSSSEN